MSFYAHLSENVLKLSHDHDVNYSPTKCHSPCALACTLQDHRRLFISWW